MPALTGIRFPLALWVLAHHMIGSDRMIGPLSPPLQAIVDSAWLSLTGFFAISGFVLARRYRGTAWTTDTIARYAIARAGRIYPLYFLSLLMLLPFIVEALREDALGSPAARAGLVANYILLLQGWIRPPVSWNTPAWSLSCEVFFYACAPLVLWLVRRRILSTVAIACAVPILLRLTIEPPIQKALLYFGDFLIGIAAANVYEHLRERRADLVRIGSWLSGLTLAAALALLFSRDLIGSFLAFDTGVRLTSGALVVALACGGWLARTLATRPMRLGGQCSFAIYILHVPLLWWYERLLPSSIPTVLSGPLFAALVLLVAVGASRSFEYPANDMVRHWGARVWSGARRRQALTGKAVPVTSEPAAGS